MSTCLDERALFQLYQGSLGPPELGRAQQHLAGCRACQNRLASFSSEGPDSSSGLKDLTHPGAHPGERLAKGHTLGRYVILDLLGSGGMGVVYSAYDPQLDRRIALKLMRTEVTSPDASVRLLREAQAIAKLSHPNVIAVYDVGTAGDSVFIAVELVKGGTLRQWLLAEARNWREILRAFIEAGKGLAAAHEAGLVHRDFKPDNVLVGEDGRVRVTDFGLARLASESNEQPVPSVVAAVQRDSPPLHVPLTESMAVLGTLPYMAPEQLSGERADAQCDQFSFCVSLYEALLGTRPFHGRTVDELCAQIEQGYIPTLAKKASIPGWLHRAVIRGLASKPQDRYPSMAGLLATLQSDPDVARRRRLSIAAAIILGIGSTVGLYGYARHLRPSCDEAGSALIGVWDDERKDAVNKAFLASGKPFANDVFRQASRELDAYAQQWVQGRVLACRVAQKRELPDVTAVRALCLEQRLAELKATANLMVKAEPEVIASAVEIAEHLSPVSECENASSVAIRSKTPFDPKIRIQVAHLQPGMAEAEVQQTSGNYKQGLMTIGGVLEHARQIGHRPAIVDALLLQAQLQADSGDFRSAEKAGREAVRMALEDGNDQAAAKVANFMVWLGTQNGHYLEAHLWADQAGAYIARSGGNERLQAELFSNEGGIYVEEGQYEKALDLLNRALALQESVLGPEHISVAKTLNRIGRTLFDYRPSEALESLRRSVEIERKLLGAKHPSVGVLMTNLGAAYLELQDSAGASPNVKESVSILEEALGPRHPRLAYALVGLGNLEVQQGRYLEAVQHLQRSMAIFEETFGPLDPKVALPLGSLGLVSVRQGRFTDALGYFQRQLALCERQGLEHPDLIEPLVGLASVSFGQHRYSSTLQLLGRALGLARKSLPPNHRTMGLIDDWYGQVWLALGRPERAIPELERAVEILGKTLKNDAPQYGDILVHLGTAYLLSGKPQLARPLLEQANRIADSSELDDRRRALRQFALAKVLWQDKRDRKRAVELAGRSQELLMRSRSATRGERTEIASWLRIASKTR